MKSKLLFFALAGLTAIAGCNKNDTDPSDAKGISGPKATVSFSIDTPESVMTKASADFEADGVIKGTVQIFIFNSNGTWDAYKSFSAADADGKYSMECTVGEDKHIHVIVNSPSLSNVNSEDKLIKQKLNLKSITAESGIPMYGYLATDVSASSSISIQVKRMVAKVIVKKVLAGPDFAADGVLTLKDLYMLNAPGEVNYVKRTAEEDLTNWDSISWYNKMKYDDGTFDALHTEIADNLNLKKYPYTGTSWFYVLPNKFTNDDAQGGAWSPRPTRLGIKTSFKSTGKPAVTYYYPITINPKDASGNITAPIEANKVYTFETITINHLGSTSDDVPVTAANVSFTVSVADWVEMPAVNPVI